MMVMARTRCHWREGEDVGEGEGTLLSLERVP